MKSKIIVEGIEYSSIQAACKHYQLSYGIVLQRINNLNWSIEEAFEVIPRKTKATFEVNGVWYPTRSAAARHHKLDAEMVRARISIGWTINQAFDLDPHPSKRKNEGGVIYIIRNSQNDKVYIGLTYKSVEQRFKEHIIRAKSSQYTSRLYSSMREIGLSYFYIEKICECPSNEDLQFKEKSYIKEYDSINTGYNSNDGGVLGGSYGIEIEFDGKRYSSKSELANHLNIPLDAIRYRLKKGLPLDAPIISNQKEISINGKTYPSLQSAAKNQGMKYYIVKRRLQEGWSVEDAFNRNIRDYKVVIDGKEHVSLKQAAKHYQLKYQTILNRLKRGLSIEIAFEIE